MSIGKEMEMCVASSGSTDYFHQKRDFIYIYGATGSWYYIGEEPYFGIIWISGKFRLPLKLLKQGDNMYKVMFLEAGFVCICWVVWVHI